MKGGFVVIPENRLFGVIAEAFGVLPEELCITKDLEPQSDSEVLEAMEEIFG